MTVRVGLIGPKRSVNGYGLGHYMAREILNYPHCELIAVMGTTRESVGQAVNLINSQAHTTRKFSGAKYTIEQKQEFFQRDDIDLIIICSPSETHEEYICEALRRNKHVLVDKPLIKAGGGINLSARIQLARDLINIAKRKNLLLSTNCQRVAVIPLLKEKLGMSGTPSSIKIELVVGVKSNRLDDPEEVFDLLIAHPISLLVKFGAIDHESVEVSKHSVQMDSRSVCLQLKGSYKAYKSNVTCVITLRQSTDQFLSVMSITVDNIGPIDVITEGSSDGHIITRCQDRDSSTVPLCVEDTLRTSVRALINALEQNREPRCPLITNDESFTIYAIQEVMREAIESTDFSSGYPNCLRIGKHEGLKNCNTSI